MVEAINIDRHIIFAFNNQKSIWKLIIFVIEPNSELKKSKEKRSEVGDLFLKVIEHTGNQNSRDETVPIMKQYLKGKY